MKVRTSTFCGIATSAAWQSWLYEFDQDRYRNFMAKLQESKGCGDNRATMMELLDSIQKDGQEDTLVAFLRQRFPTALMDTPLPPLRIDNSIFPDYTPGVLTYPHRLIINEGENIQQQVHDFLRGKGRSDTLFVNGTAYIEYLLPEDKGIEIPESNWLLKVWREQHRAKNTKSGAK